MSFLSFEGIPSFSFALRTIDRLNSSEIDSRVNHIMKEIYEVIRELRNKTQVPFVLHNVSGLPLTRYSRRLPFPKPVSHQKTYLLKQLNEQLFQLVRDNEKCILLDEYAVAKQNGFYQSGKPLVNSKVIGKGMFHTSSMGSLLTEPYFKIMSAYQTLHKTKLILLDFDNTLWKGVMADGEVEQCSDRQNLLKKLKEQVILLAAVSKNTIDNIRWEEMVLQEEDFVVLKINWNQKVQSIHEISNQLNLSLDSFVFINDNPAERSLVDDGLKGVACLDPNDLQVWDALELMMLFPNTQSTAESKSRTEMYKAQMKRSETMNVTINFEEMMRSLNLQLFFRAAGKNDLPRIFELTSRTNQFNTTTIRYSQDAIREMYESDDYRLFVAELKDKFGNLGTVCSVLAEQTDKVGWVISSFIMSCRAMGYGVEKSVIKLVVDALKANGPGDIVGKFVPTDRNSPCADLYKNNGFIQLGEGFWVLQPEGEGKLQESSWITVSNVLE